MKKYILTFMALVVTYALLEFVSMVGLHIVSRYFYIDYKPVNVLSPSQEDILKRFLAGESDYYTFSESLGWTIGTRGRKEMYRSNSAGIRSDREYALNRDNDTLRIVTFGDSYTHSDDVGNSETWQAFIESMDSDVEALNFGVSGYGLDQAYLRYLESGSTYGADVVLIGYMPENIFRNVNTFRPFYIPQTQFPLAKPRFTIRENELSLSGSKMSSPDDYGELFESPQDTLRELGRGDYFYQRRYEAGMFDWSPLVRLVKIFLGEVNKWVIVEPVIVDGLYNENSDAFRVTTRLFDEFYASVLEDNARPVILVLPHKEDVMRQKNNLGRRYTPLLEYFDTQGYEYIDMMGKLGSDEVEVLFDGHYRPATNQIVARNVLEFLRDSNE